MTESLAGRLALVTGGRRGLGFQIARGLAERGAAVLVNGRDATRLQPAVEQLRVEGLDAAPVPFDITNLADAEEELTAHPPIDILINNVGQRDRRGTLDLPTSDFERLLYTDLVAAYGLSRLVSTRLVTERRPGAIVNISSVVGGLLANRGDVAYATAKAGLEGLTRALAADLGPHGIRVNAVAPGFFATEANADQAADSDRLAWVEARTMLRRWGQPSEIAGLVAFLAGEEASYLTGQTIALDGGLSALF
ncbi:MAG TPA: SDR family oxidoreductase [Propionibacteriaceae bacterium]|nr:SDR family oxidoreductase [Propionibacteriaceae bacterium]